jgi:hypothetical protein
MVKYERLMFALSRVPMEGCGSITATDLANDTDCSIRTAQRDLNDLEQTAHVICVDTYGKQRYYSKPRVKASLSLELAFVLSSLGPYIKEQFPEAINDAIFNEVDAAKKMVDKEKRCNKEGRLVKLFEHLKSQKRVQTLSTDDLVAMNDAIYNQKSIILQVSGSTKGVVLKPNALHIEKGSISVTGMLADTSSET